MKKKAGAPTEGTTRVADLRKNLSQEQLAGIGEVAIAYNEAEVFVDFLLGIALRLDAELYFELANRVNGIDGRLAIIRELAKRCSFLKAETLTMMDNTFAVLKELKGYRDAVAHARVLDAPTGIGQMVRRQGERIHVLLTKPALNALYDRLVAVRWELVDLVLIFTFAFRPSEFDERAPKRDSASYKQFVEEEVAGYVVQFQLHQTARRSLPPLPQFPDQPPIRLDWEAANPGPQE